jgi:hypothetical protein
MNSASSPADTALTKKVWMIGLVWIVVIVDWIGLDIPHMIVDRIGYVIHFTWTLFGLV